MKVAGIHPLGHDSCVVEIDILSRKVVASTLERYSRKKHDARYIRHLSDYDWKPQGSELAFVSNSSNVFSDIKQLQLFQKRYELDRILQKRPNYFLKLYRNLNLLLSKFFSLTGKKTKTNYEKLTADLKEFVASKKILRADHHLCHAASVFYTRPKSIEDCLVITLDGQGDESSGKVFTVLGGELVEKSSNDIKDSICGLYSIFTEVAGYAPNADEGKLEALANFYKKETSDLRSILNEAFVVEKGKLRMQSTSDWPFSDVFFERRKIMTFLNRFLETMSKEEFAFVIQTVFEEKVSSWINFWTNDQSQTLCLAGGGFANVKLNRLLFEKYNHNIHVFPAMGDDGAAFGAAVIAARYFDEELAWLRDMKEPYYGRTSEKVNKLHLTRLSKSGLNFRECSEEEVQKFIAKNMILGNVGAIYQGSAEFGPRALGNRSIIAAGTDPNVRDDLNNRFKRREWYQPFCPMILQEDAETILEKYYLNRHMTCAFTVKKEYQKKIPAVVHVDGTARAQIITPENKFWYDVLIEVKSKLGLGVALNTSFNLHGRAIVNSVDQALDDFLDCGIDYLVLNNVIITR